MRGDLDVTVDSAIERTQAANAGKKTLRGRQLGSRIAMNPQDPRATAMTSAEINRTCASWIPAGSPPMNKA